MEALNELESFAYHPSGKEKAAADAPEPPRKRARPDARRQAAELLAEAEQALTSSQVEVTDTVDENTMKRMILSVEKRINENMAFRMKYAEQPERFMDSELELFQELKALHCVAAAPELFPVFVKTKCTASLLGLLAHENMDISSDVVDLFNEMTDADDASPQQLQILADAVVEQDGIAMLMAHLERLTEANEEEATTIHSTLGIFENLLEARPELSDELAGKAGLMKWLLARLKVRGFHANKLYAAELLSVLLQQNSENQLRLGQMEGILSLLTAASQYKRRDPQDLEEAELIENTFGCLCLVLEQPQNQHLFLKAEGIELMIMTLKEFKYASRCALRVLDSALGNNGANCERFVDIRGFKSLFPLVGASPPPQPAFAKGKKEREAAQKQFDESIVGIVCTLFHQLVDDRRLRLLGKFAEDDMAKLDRLLALRVKYAVAVASAEEAFEEEEDGEEEEEEEEMTPDERLYVMRSEAGLQTLQLIDHCLAYTVAAKAKGSNALRQRILMSLYEAGSSLHDVWANVEEYAKLSTSDSQDRTRSRHLEEMGEAVKAILSKYRDTDAAEEGVDAAVDADGAASSSAQGAMLPPPPLP